MNIFTIEDIACRLNKNKLVIRHWILWDEENENKYLPKPIKVIRGRSKTRLYDSEALLKFIEFDKYLKNHPGLMAEYNKKHFWGKRGLKNQ